MPPPTRLAVIAAAALCAGAATAQAHAPAAEFGSFYAGALHPLTSLEHLLAFVAFGLFAAQQGARAQLAMLVFAGALVGGGLLALLRPSLPGVDTFNLASAVALGLLVAAAPRLPPPALHALAALFGLSHGYANGAALAAPLKAWLYLPGTGLAGLLVAAYSFVLLDFIARRNSSWMPIAVRVAGSWIAAIGILVLGIGLRPLASG